MKLKHIILFWIFFSICTSAFANPALKTMDVKAQNHQILVCLGLNEKTADPVSFATDNPARVILDFPGVANGLTKEQSKVLLSTGVVKKIRVLEVEGRMRVILDLINSVPYEIKRDHNNVCVVFSDHTNPSDPKVTPFAGTAQKNNAIKEIGFRRGEKEQGNVIIDLAGAKMPIDLKEEGTQIVLRFPNTHIPEHLIRTLNVKEFGTPIISINTFLEGKDGVMQIKLKGLTENRAYQADNRFTLEVIPMTKAQEQASKETKDIKAKKASTEYNGERLSLNFQDIEVRAVLQLIADFTGLNIVTSDSVTGNVTLRLRNVPWDQALAIILKSKGLEKRQVGNVLWIGPSEEIAAREKLELQANQQVEDLVPLRSEYIQINYAKATAIALLLKAEKNSLLSSRGSVSVDERTNMLLVQDTPVKISEIRKLVQHLDIPIKQVLIEARIVLADDNFEDALGVQFGIASSAFGNPRLGIAGVIDNGSSPIALGAVPASVAPINRLAVNLPQFLLGGGTAFGQLGLTLAKLPGGTVLDLELMALESEGLGKIVSSPRLMTSDQHLAYIESGEEIPYNESTSSGAAAIAFKKAVLRLEVTPQITPDNHIILTLKVNQDSRGVNTSNGLAINTRELQTKVLVANGETIVLGGIYEQTTRRDVTRVPILGRLPYIGPIFSSEHNIDTRKELMIFVTPKIVTEGMGC